MSVSTHGCFDPHLFHSWRSPPSKCWFSTRFSFEDRSRLSGVLAEAQVLLGRLLDSVGIMNNVHDFQLLPAWYLWFTLWLLSVEREHLFVKLCLDRIRVQHTLHLCLCFLQSLWQPISVDNHHQIFPNHVLNLLYFLLSLKLLHQIGSLLPLLTDSFPLLFSRWVAYVKHTCFVIGCHCGIPRCKTLVALCKKPIV